MGALIAAGIAALGTYYTNQQNSANSQRQMDFQREMSNSAHQREVDDLRKAGLNPILSAGGQGASTPQGSMANNENPVANMMATAMQYRQQQKDFEQKDAGIENTKADTANKSANADLIRNQTNQSAMEIRSKNLQNRLLEQTMEAQIKKAKAEGDYSEINQIMGLIGAGANSASSLINPLKILKGKK